MKRGLIFVLIFSMLFFSAVNEFQKLPLTGKAIDCTPEWDCTSYSPCVGGKQIRTCVDYNLCGDESTRPEEIINCEEFNCISDWDCTNWGKCTEENTESRTCTDKNKCEIPIDKPIEVQNCEYKEDFEWLFLVFIIVIVLVIILVLSLILGLSLKQKKGEDDYKLPKNDEPPKPNSESQKQAEEYRKKILENYQKEFEKQKLIQAQEQNKINSQIQTQNFYHNPEKPLIEDPRIEKKW